MVFSWLKDKDNRRNELLAEPFPAAWREYLVNNVRHYAFLEPPEQAMMQAVARVVVAEKNWSGGGGFSVTDEMKVTVAAQASLMVLGLDEPYYFDRVQSIILYPDTYVNPPRPRGNSNLPEWLGIPHSGEAWYHSPIILSWKDVLQAGRNASNGNNLVLHEFAHHLDGLDGDVDGTPPFAEREQEKIWYRVTEAEYRKLVGSAKRREVTLLNHYGATNRAEFFAVATECFFERPHAMQRQHEQLYKVLQDFYLQDPAQWVPDAAITSSNKASGIDEDRERADAEAIRSEDADDLFTFAVTCINEERYDLAEKAASKAIDLDPSDAEVYQVRAAARAKLGKYKAALDDCQRALDLDDSDVEVYRTRGAAYVGLQQFELAIDDLDRVLQDNKNDAEAYRLRGLALTGLDQLRRALSDFSMSIAINSFSAEAFYQRGQAYRKLGRAEEADADLEKALQLDPEVGRR